MSLNKVMLIGHLGDRPRLQQLEDGRMSVGLSVVTKMTRWFDVETGEERHGDEWHRVVVVQPDLVDIAQADLRQNDQIYVEGQLQTQCWQDETFEWRSLTRIILSRDSDQLRRLGKDEIAGPICTPRHDVSARGRAQLVECTPMGGPGHG